MDFLKSLWSLDARLSTDVMGGTVLRVRSRRIRWLRHTIQGLTAAIVAWIGWAFARWVLAVEAGNYSLTRPAGVEGFLPISGLMSLRHLLTSGEVHPVHPAALVILIAVVGTSLVLKKSFCSWLCPVGTVSEALATIGETIFGRRLTPPRWLDVPLRGLKYVLLGFFVYIIFIVMSPADVAAFLASPYNIVADAKMLDFFARLSPFALRVLIALALASILIPYAWCRYLCPYGALLGVVSLLSPLKVTRDHVSCIDCGLCTKACPSRLPVERLTRVRSDECIACLSCVAACPVSRALTIETPARFRATLRPVAIALLVLFLFFGTIAAGRAIGAWNNGITNQQYEQHLRDRDNPRYIHAQ